MITKTLNLDSSYQDLFDEVREASNGAINVDNLEAFFGSIVEIAALDPKFLRLPLDEPLFEIDANTRKITIPAEFRTNGASVLGDHLAEVIFFRIARYFDYKDLSTCDIEINWKMGTKEGKTTRFIKFDDVLLIDDVKTDCIIFGWPINDVVTEKSGALTFAVEFNQTEGDGDQKKVIYRFNTLPTTINIKDGLVLGENVEAVQLDNDIIRTLINSSFGEGTAAVGDIVWLTGEGNGLVVGEGNGSEVNLRDYASIVSLPTAVVAGVPESGSINMYAQAFIDEGTKLQYNDGITNDVLIPTNLLVKRPFVQVEEGVELDEDTAYYSDSNGLNLVAVSDLEDAEVLYKADALIDGLKYYVLRAGAEEGVYDEASEDDLATWGKRDAVPLYVSLAKITADTAGSYSIKALGYKVDSQGQKIGSGEVESTKIVTIPVAEAPTAINLALSEPPVINEDGYSFSENLENTVFLGGTDNNATITAKPIIDMAGALKFDWLKKNGDNFESIEENVQFKLVEPNVEPEDILVVTEPGTYKVSVVNFLNDTESNETKSAEVLVSKIAGVITGAKVKVKRGNTTYSNVTGNIRYNSSSFSPTQLNPYPITLKVDEVTIVENGYEGQIEYQWFKYNDESLEPIENAVNAELPIENGNEGEFVPVVKNNCNGSIYTYTLNSVTVDDSANN